MRDLRKLRAPTVVAQLACSLPTTLPEASASGLVKTMTSPSEFARDDFVLVLRTCLKVEPFSSSVRLMVRPAGLCAEAPVPAPIRAAAASAPSARIAASMRNMVLLL
jgi:hypothetical protein